MLHLDSSNPRPFEELCFASIPTKICLDFKSPLPGPDGSKLNLTPASFCVPSENFANSEDSSHEIIETFA